MCGLLKHLFVWTCVHRFPRRKTPAFRAWVRFVQVRRRDFASNSVSSNSVICGFHFREEDYIEGDIIQHKMGFRIKDQVRLKSTAVPSVHRESNGREHGLESAPSPCSGRRRSRTSHKLEVARMINMTPEVETTEGSPEAAESPETPGDVTDDSLSLHKHSSTRVNRATQCGYRQLISHRSTATQAALRPPTRDMGTQYEESDVLWHSTPLSSPASSPEPIDEQDESFKPFEDSDLMSTDDSFPVDFHLPCFFS